MVNFFVTITMLNAFIIIEATKGGNSRQCSVSFVIKKYENFLECFREVSNYLGETRNEKL